MPHYLVDLEVTAAEALPPDIAAALQGFLNAHGYVVNGVTVQLRPSPALVIDADKDPFRDVSTWTPTPTVKRDQFLKARTLIFAYRDKVVANQAVTATETARALAALITLTDQLAKTI